jgi:hypothetical protein
MASAETVHITGPGGLREMIYTNAWPLNSSRAKALLQFEGGALMLVPLEMLAWQDDGGYRLILNSATFERRGR